jgi:hypothetical protein
MGNTTLWIALASLALGALTLFLGMRGKRIDREPRCPARRCKYALGGVISAKRAQGDEAFPLTCPECGRAITNERSLRIGTRRRIKPIVALGLAMLLVSVGVVGFEGYAAWQSTKAVNTMPMWLLLRNAERDTDANRFVHQRELLDRALASKISAKQAPAIIERIMEWQADPNVEYRWAANTLSDLAQQGLLTEEQQNRAWANMWLFDLRAPDSVEPGRALPLTFLAHYRGGVGAGMPLIWEHPWDQHRARGFSMSHQTDIRVESLRINGKTIDLPEDYRTLRSLSHIAEEADTRTLGWSTIRGPWGIVVAPNLAPGARVEIEADLVWDFTDSGQNGLQADPEQGGKWVTVGQWLAHRGVPTKGAATVRSSTRIAPNGSIAPTLVDREEVNNWLRNRLAKSVVKVVRQPQGDYFVYISDGWGDMNNLPADPPTVFGRLIIHHNGWSRPIGALADHAVYGSVGDGGFGDRTAMEMMGMYIAENPTGWELELVANPEESLMTAERPHAWAGAPIRTPIAVELDIRCFDAPAIPMLFVPEGNPRPEWPTQ